MPSSDTDSWTDKNQVLTGGHYAHPLSSESEESIFDFSDWSDSEFLQDSVSQKRRHGVYFPRPPVWVKGSSRTESQFAGCIRCYASGEEECICGSSGLRETLDCLNTERETYSWSGNHDQRIFCNVTAATANALASIDASVSESATTPLLIGTNANQNGVICGPPLRAAGQTAGYLQTSLYQTVSHQGNPTAK
ncbi:hypothetical protein BBP40_008321 [Aspergillus hancockii]|nr:hypothetical protein BBP40_008321 [Aspergillus hancockii]